MKKISHRKSLISIVIPFYNEQENVEELYRRFTMLFALEKKYTFELIAVEHGSTDSTFAKLLNLHQKDKRVKILQLSKNFGTADAGIIAGLHFVKGSALVITTADLQDPPELISKFLRKWENGYEIVYGIIKKRADFSKLRSLNSKLFYKILRLMIGTNIPENASDFRLIDKKVYLEINQMPERNKFLKGLMLWTGFNQIGIP